MPKVTERPSVTAPAEAKQALDTTNLTTSVLRQPGNHLNPFVTFDDHKDDWLRQHLSPELMTRAAQYISGVALSKHDLVNLHGWTEEETAIYNRRNEGEQ